MILHPSSFSDTDGNFGTLMAYWVYAEIKIKVGSTHDHAFPSWSFSFFRTLGFWNSDYARTIRPSLIHHSVSGIFSFRKGQWKYVEGAGSGGWSKDESATREWPAQLYDLANDPAEMRNLWKEKSEIAAELKTHLAQQRAAGFTETGAKN